jgi:hypothetical protein
MFGLLKSVAELTGNVAKVVVAPVEIAVDLAAAATKPLAEAAEELTKDVKSLKD